jgi:ATP-binding cassette subfamily B protein IrtB
VTAQKEVRTVLEILRKFFRFCDERERSEFYRSIVLGVLAALFSALKIPAIGVMLQAILVEGVTAKTILLSLAVMLISVIGSSILKYRATALQTDGGYSTTANKRVQIAEHLRYLPMGYFNDQSLGELTGITTTVLDEVESTGPMVLVGILGGLINSAVMLLCVLFWDWRIGLLALAGMLVYLALLSGMEKQSAKIAPKRQRDEARLVEAVLEQLQGMSVIKSFNLTGKGDKRVRQALEDSRANNLAVEKLFTPYIWGQEMVLHLFSVLILAASVGLCLTGAMSLANALMAVIVSFLIFSQIQSAGSGVSALRLVGSSIDHANQVDDIPEMDQRGTAIRPESHEIVFDHVNFSYGSRPILKDVSLIIPDRTTTAIVGPSGSGKTTLCNLIARFWDVDGGRVTIGGRDVREYTLESLMEQVSMVFQRVYLFADTVENNIKFGCPGATHKQVVEAAKKACCHDFISALPDGYNTVIGEGGATLSGGEKQRISIARCLLKDAPIVIFDEATANVDPENEDQLQKAMEALTREKTVLMIAHRLKTVRGADQILVVDQGRVVQKGTHDELIRQAGIYRDFVSERTESSRWTL